MTPTTGRDQDGSERAFVYLQNVRDLEIVRTKIWREWKAQLARIDEKIKHAQTQPYYQMVPAFKYEPLGCLGWFCVFGVAVCALTFIGVTGEAIKGEMDAGPIPVIMLIVGIVYALPLLGHSTEKTQRKEYDAQVAEIQAYNDKQDQIAQRGKTQVEQYQQTKKKTDDIYRKKYNEAARILSRFYAMNILPNQYRNLASTVYIYDYMSSSQASLEDTLIHEHMEDGIQRLAARLDRMADRLEEVVYETRCIRVENRANVERTIDRNERMLRQLESVSYNTQEAARYAELASNYSKANAYFALADHLK